MKNKAVQTTDDAARIEAALARIREGQNRRVTHAPAPVPEIYELHCVCAVFDCPYTLRFVRQPSGLLRFAAGVRENPFKTALTGKAAMSPAFAALRLGRPGTVGAGSGGYTLRMEDFEPMAPPCAWCGCRGFNHCSCGALVCGGRMQGNTFHCRKSCGAAWVGVPLQEVEGALQEQPSPPRPSSPAPANTSHPARAGQAPLRLPAGALHPDRRK